MPIDNCQHTFAELVQDVLPRYMAELRSQMTTPHAMADFAIEGLGIRTLLQRFQLEGDFRGCYVLMEVARPVYVGISQAVLQRLRQHVRGATHRSRGQSEIIAHRIQAVILFWENEETRRWPPCDGLCHLALCRWTS